MKFLKFEIKDYGDQVVITHFSTLNLKRTFYAITSYILIGSFFLGLLMTVIGLGYRGRYHAASNVCWYVAIPGLFILLPFIVWFIISNRKLQRQNIERLRKLKNLKLTGIEKVIDLRLVQIEEDNQTIDIGNTLLINRYGNENHFIKLTISVEGKKIDYSFFTDINEDNLKVHFAMHQYTNIYFDKSNKNNCYLDLEFLEA